jgi:hypothetical protein
MPIPARDVALGSRVPWFSIESLNGHGTLTPRLAREADSGRWRPLLVMFLCNHSPYVKHIEEHLGRMLPRYQAEGLAVVAISPNDPVSYPSDDEESIRGQIQRAHFDFPYALDENQSIARAFEASCTPEFFLYSNMDRGGRLVYHGEYDSTRPGHERDADGSALQSAIEAVLHDRTFRDNQEPSFGCSVKWKSGLDATAALALG